MSTVSDPAYLTVGRYLVWVAASLIGTAIALVDGYYFHDINKTYWAVFIPLQVCVIIPAISYVSCLTPRPTTFCNGFMKMLHFTFWQISIQALQQYLTARMARQWASEMATWASLDVIFVFSLGLNVGILSDFTTIALFIQPIQFHRERAGVYLRPNTLDANPHQRDAMRWFFNRLLIFYNRIVIILALTMSWIPTLLFFPMDAEVWKKAIVRTPNWRDIGYGLLVFFGYPLAFAFPVLLWKCQVGQDCRRQAEQEPQAEAV